MTVARDEQGTPTGLGRWTRDTTQPGRGGCCSASAFAVTEGSPDRLRRGQATCPAASGADSNGKRRELRWAQRVGGGRRSLSTASRCAGRVGFALGIVSRSGEQSVTIGRPKWSGAREWSRRGDDSARSGKPPRRPELRSRSETARSRHESGASGAEDVAAPDGAEAATRRRNGSAERNGGRPSGAVCGRIFKAAPTGARERTTTNGSRRSPSEPAGRAQALSGRQLIHTNSANGCRSGGSNLRIHMKIEAPSYFRAAGAAPLPPIPGNEYLSWADVFPNLSSLSIEPQLEIFQSERRMFVGNLYDYGRNVSQDEAASHAWEAFRRVSKRTDGCYLKTIAAIPEARIEVEDRVCYVDLVIFNRSISERYVGIEIDGRSHYEDFNKKSEENTPWDRMAAFTLHTQRDRFLRRFIHLIRFSAAEVMQSDFESTLRSAIKLPY